MNTNYRTASPIPAYWELDDPHTWTLSGTADAFEGIHGPTGMEMRGYRDIRASPSDLGYAIDPPGNGQTWDDVRAWWWDVVEADYDYQMLRAEMDYDQEYAILDRLGFDTIDQWQDRNLGTGDLELDATHQRRFLGEWDAMQPHPIR